MYAEEFKTVVNEPCLKIPNYEKFKGQEVKVILLSIIEKSRNNKNDFIEYLANNPVKLDQDTKFLSRDEAHER